MNLKSGSRLRSQVDATEVIVVRAPAGQVVVVSCGGHPMIDAKAEPEPGLSPVGDAEATQLGKRYTDGDGALELLVTKPGTHGLAANGQPVVLKEAKPLPASD
jgi:hypothetical protein